MSTDTTDARKIDRGEELGGCPVSRGADGVWLVRGHAAARAALRSTDTVQAGLGVETVEKMPGKIRRPVLYRDGPEHREHRRQTAKYFTPRRVDEAYRGIMERVTDEQLAKLRHQGHAQLSELSFALSIDVACAVIGLTESRPGLAQRLERFFPEEFGEPGFTSINGLYWVWRQARNWSSIFLNDVRPAVRARRAQRRDDLISHLLDEGCSAAEILGECITFAAAGMITTREFINLSAWHLFTDDALRERYQAAEEPERIAILHELLRLEPVVGHLKRRATAPVELPGEDGETVTVPAGEVIDVQVSATNTDQRAVGEQPLAVCPARPLTDATAPGMSFGDGAHKCPGSNVAILETDVFLSKLFALPGVGMRTPPRVSMNEAIGGYELRGMVVELQ
ncbi:Cytochrome P450 [Saccharopolyspora kobensis]|uniref:Cytochrome P450 n=2 Tax=Saccharopolyspora kobensis TaxID=146035 RepID=A0A1H6ENT2_9PSEU|nr:cytochrome P450 [Saccharopolyspora kobensis]SEG98751.1 Cytochrome P450 [Saccharopolyspora kobensis]SFF28911.1 Cytochrome P450 [Saccharopolyspora kobensis]